MVSTGSSIAQFAATPQVPTAALHHRADPHLKAFESFIDAATAPGLNRQLTGVAAVAVDKTGKP